MAWILASVGCAAHVVPQRFYPPPPKPATEVARLWNVETRPGWFLPVIEIDGRKVTGTGLDQWVLEVLPGDHTLRIQADSIFNRTLKWHAKAGRNYSIDVQNRKMSSIYASIHTTVWNFSGDPVVVETDIDKVNKERIVPIVIDE